MMLYIMYLGIGILVGFLIKHEIDIRQKKNRIEKKLQAISTATDIAPYAETLNMVKDLNKTLLLIQNQKQQQQKMIHRL